MINLQTGKFIFDSVVLWIDLGLSIVLLTLLTIACKNTLKKASHIFVVIALDVSIILAWLFSLNFVWMILLIIMVGFYTYIVVSNKSDLKILLPNYSSKKKVIAEKVYDKHNVVQTVAVAIETLARTKTGALITFEKQDKLNDVVKSGTILNCPITPELITTIFYPGTRLHDGAVVIRGDLILAASVYYTPTTKPLTGKFGSRHRAAIGISEKTDAVTVVVSEETGRISIAYKGELIPVGKDILLKSLEEYLITNAEEEVTD